jgi:hypothetical protein
MVTVGGKIVYIYGTRPVNLVTKFGGQGNRSTDPTSVMAGLAPQE